MWCRRRALPPQPSSSETSREGPCQRRQSYPVHRSIDNASGCAIGQGVVPVTYPNTKLTLRVVAKDAAAKLVVQPACLGSKLGGVPGFLQGAAEVKGHRFLCQLDFDDLDVAQTWPDAGLMGFIYVFVAQQPLQPVRARARARGDAEARRRIREHPATVAPYFLARASQKNVRDRHDMSSVRDPSSPLIKTDATIKKILSAMGLPTEAPRPCPARPPPGQSGGEGVDLLD
jgi:hypothetical protein